MAQDRFSRFDVVITLVSFITLLLDVVTDLAVAVQLYVQLELLWGSLVLGFLVVPLLVVAIVSLKWHSTDGSLTCSTLLPHACLVAPFQRYLEVLSLAYKSVSTGHPRDVDAALRKQNDASILRLFGTFLESAPQLLLQLSIMSYYPSSIHPIQVWSAVSSLFSLAWALTVHCDSSRLNYQTPYVRRFLAITVHLLWQLFMVTARVTALVVFASTFHAWICLFVGGHWVIMTACIWMKGTSFGQGRWEKVLFHVASGFIYVFVYQNIHEGRSRGRMGPYYCLAFVENGVLFSFWVIYGKPALDLNVAGAVLIFGGFLLGGLCLLLYYRCLHPSGPNHLFVVKLPSSRSQHQTAQLLKPKDNTPHQKGELLMESPPALQNLTLELCVETETPQKGAGVGAGDVTFLVDSARREALVSAWQSGMGSSDSSSSSSSLDADDCSLEEFNATARSSSLVLKDIPQSEHADSQSRLSSVTGRSHHTDPSARLQSAPDPAVSQHSLYGSVVPRDYIGLPDLASPCAQNQAEIEDVEMKEADSSEEEGERTVVTAVQGSQGPRIQVSRPSASPEVETPPAQPLLEHHPSSTPTPKPQDTSNKVRLQSELSGGRKELQSTSGVVSPLVDLPLPESLIPSTPSSSDILPSRRRTDAVDRLSETFVLGESPVVSGQGPEQSSLPRVRSGDMSFVRGSREAMAAYPESLSPESQQPKLFLGSDDIYGDRAGGESMWGISPDPSNNSSSQSRERALSRPVSSGRVPRLVDDFDSDPDPADLRTEVLQGLKCLSEEDECEVSLKDSLVLENPDTESPAANNNDTEISWSSMNVNENEWSGLNNLKALTPNDSLCSFASNEREEQQPHNTHTDRALRQPENSPTLGAGDEAFSRASTPSLPRSHSTSSLYHEFSSAGVSPSPPPGLRTGSRLSRNHSWVSSPFCSEAWHRPADTAWPLEYLSVDPAPPVDGDPYPSRMDPRELVIELLMDQLKRTSLRSGRSPQFPAHSSSHLRSPSVPDERLDPGMVRHLVSGDPNATVVARPEQGVHGRRAYRSDIDLMRQALDLIEMERFPHRFQPEALDTESSEVYVSGQYRPPIVDQGRETPPHPPAPRASVGTHSRSQLNTSLRQASSVPSAALPPQPSGPQRSGHHAGVGHNTTHPPPGLEAQSGGSGPGARKGLYRYFVHSDSPIHTPSWSTPQNTPAGTPSQRHLLHRYLTQSHVESGLREERVQSAETRSLRRPPPSVARDRLSSTLPAGLAVRAERVPDNPAHTAVPPQGRRMPGSLPGGFVPQASRASDSHPHHPNPHAGRVVPNVHPHADRVVPNVHPHADRVVSNVHPRADRVVANVHPRAEVPNVHPHADRVVVPNVHPHADRAVPSVHPHGTTTRTSGFVPHTLIPHAGGRLANVRCYTERLEVVTPDAVATPPDNPDSGMHSGTQSAASRRHPLQSLDNSPSLSPTSLTHQPVHTKPTPHTQGTVGSDRHKPPHGEGRRGSGQSPQVTGSPRHSSSRSRSHSQGHRQSAERGGDCDHHAASLAYVPDSSVSGQAKSVDCLR